MGTLSPKAEEILKALRDLSAHDLHNVALLAKREIARQANALSVQKDLRAGDVKTLQLAKGASVRVTLDRFTPSGKVIVTEVGGWRSWTCHPSVLT